jgi:hypothetical protein
MHGVAGVRPVCRAAVVAAAVLSTVLHCGCCCEGIRVLACCSFRCTVLV